MTRLSTVRSAARWSSLLWIVGALAFGLWVSWGEPVSADAAVAADAELTSPIEARELQALIDAGEAPVIVDVRSRSEYVSGHIPGAIHIPFWKAVARADEIPGSPDDPVVVYCEHGPRAVVAKGSFLATGRSRVILLRGHMQGWKKAGLPQQVGGETAREPIGSAAPD